MNTKNPFQIPSCLQRAQLQQRRQTRLKTVVIGSIAALTTLLVFLLVAGCMSDRTKSASSVNAPALAGSGNLPDAKGVVPGPKTVVVAQPKPVVSSNSRAAITPPAKNGAEILYVVKPGDTLSRIAKLHGLTIQSIKTVNGLVDDRLVVGLKLKLRAV